jgi:glycosyltransferase involved in cell wall biosynthesis
LLERRVPVVYDFDDALFVGDVSAANRSIARFKMPEKISRIVAKATITTAGNEWLAAWARRYSSAVEVIPTTIDVDQYRTVHREPAEHVVVGWSGSKTTVRHLQTIEGALRRALSESRVSLSVVGDRSYTVGGLDDDGLVRARDWVEASELDDLGSFDIGLMPLPDEDWSRGKCGLKALQYMAMEVVPIVSPIGVNREIVQHGENGLIATGDDEWVAAIQQLASDAQLRRRLGRAARATVVERYSGKAWAPRFLQVLEQAASARG